jgi:hypothetical protein
MLSLLEKELSSRLSLGIDGALRMDLINCYGHNVEEVNKMTEDDVYALMDKYEAKEKGYDYDEDEDQLPHHISDTTCKCKGKLKVLFVDCETRGDCEIYVCECTSCNNTISINYAEEWFEEY